jgi:polysaccharide deacetylase family protein (PEP-CTERM system associated)
VNALTVDVEEWYTAFRFRGIGDWEGADPRTGEGLSLLLHLLRERGVRATCFLLGHYVARDAGLVGAIVADGHELGIHGYDHRPLWGTTPAAFADDLRRALEVIAASGGGRPRLHRAPCCSVGPDAPWVWRTLDAFGITVDSSWLPAPRFAGGSGRVAWRPCRIPVGNGRFIQEYPLASARVFGVRWPLGSGLALRTLPLTQIARGLEVENRAGRGVVLCVHGWEFDPAQPVVAAPQPLRFAHYHGLREFMGRIRWLLERFPFGALSGTTSGAPLPVLAR